MKTLVKSDKLENLMRDLYPVSYFDVVDCPLINMVVKRDLTMGFIETLGRGMALAQAMGDKDAFYFFHNDTCYFIFGDKEEVVVKAIEQFVNSLTLASS